MVDVKRRRMVVRVRSLIRHKALEEVPSNRVQEIVGSASTNMGKLFHSRRNIAFVEGKQLRR